jgi:hypothetical protein
MSPDPAGEKQIEAHAVAASFQLIAPVLQISRKSADNIDGDEIIRDCPICSTLPHKWIKGKEEFKGNARSARQDCSGRSGRDTGRAAGVADVVKTVADAHHATARGNAANADAQAATRAGAGVTERKANPSGRPIRKTEVKGRSIWRVPERGSVIPRLQDGKDKIEAIGFTARLASDDYDNQ